jgi:uncharacterized protein
MVVGFIVSEKASEGRLVLAVCDSDVYGRKLEEGDTTLDLSSEFYKGEEKSKGEVSELIGKAYMMNVVGEESVALVLELGFGEKEAVKTVEGIPHIQIVRV